MALSNELISEFVKATKDTGSNTKDETVVYATTVERDGSMYVQIDGSELLTPVTATANTVAGERVTVMIKNHTATITGNISSPAARIDDVSDVAKKISEFEIVIATKVSTEEFDAEVGRIDSLVSDNVLVKNKLIAAEGDIDNLQANVLTVTDKVTAAEGNITKLQTEKLDADLAEITYATITDLDLTNGNVHNLEATYANFATATADKLDALEAEIDNLDAGTITADEIAAVYATIAQLNAEKGRITDLEAEVADIDTLMFGSATGNTIQTSFANAVISQLGEAQIKSAMIENVSASKLNAGDINTNKVGIISEDGKLLISDETIQISDNTRIRVQIGKDASNDYSINIWDTDGKLMFSEGGITDNAIKDAIIRNDMVSDNANIAAHKLDIDSLFEEINGSAKTIKSSRILLDDKNQTLNVAFESMSTDIEELQNGVSSHGTQITAIQGQIASKVWQNDINTAINDVNETTENLSTQYEEIVQDVSGLTATVSNHTSEISKKANSSTVTEVNNKVASMETDLSGFKTEVSTTYATKTALGDASDSIDGLTERMESAETSISNNTSAINLRATKTEVSTAKSEAILSANSNTANLLKSYSTTEEMEAAIRVESNSIKSSVSSTYATQTALATTNTNVTAAKKAADDAQADINGLAIGGRNLLKDTRFDGEAKRHERLEGAGTEGGFRFEPTEQIESGVEYVLSLSMRGNANIVFYEINSSGGNFAHAWIRREQLSETEFREFYLTFTVATTRVFDEVYICTQYGEEATAVGDWFELQSCTVKLERGNRKTDWSPAPEDMATSGDISAVQKSIESTEERLIASETVIQQLSDSIIHLVTDGEGQSLMTQTEDGWTFSTKEIQDMVNATSEGLSGLIEEVGDVNSTVGILQRAVDELGVLNDYVKITTYEDEPCIELGETDSDFKLLITNTRILFMEGNDVPAYITNQALHIKKAVIEEELQQGGFLWKARSNGNLGLVWKGV